MNSEILNILLKSSRKLHELESTPRLYSSGEKLYASEVHTLCVISQNPGINLTGISHKMDISKSAVSKFVKKLHHKKHLTKITMEHNLKEVHFNLTDSGQAIVKEHDEFREKTFTPLLNKVNDLTPEKQKIVLDVLSDLYSLL